MEGDTAKDKEVQFVAAKNGSVDVEAEKKTETAEESWRDRTIVENCNVFRSYITVEPLLACYIMPSVIASLAVQNLNLEKACRVNLNYSDELCDSLIQQTTNGTDEEIQVQSLVAYMGAWRLPLQTALPAIMILFIGAWSDRTGKRKACLLVPIIGEFLTSVGLILCTYYFLQWPLEIAGVIEALPPSLTGGYATMFLGIFSYLADNTTPEERTFRIGIVNTFISLALPVGLALSGILLNELGFYGVFIISMLFYVAAFIYGYIRIKDKKKETSAPAQKTSCMKTSLHFMSIRHVFDTFIILYKKRDMSKRLQIILLVACYIVVAGPTHGAGGIQYLYARRNYQFTEVEFSIFSAYTIIVNFFGVLFALSILSKHFQMNDYLLGALACISKLLASFVYALAPTKNWLYLAPIVELIGGTAVIAMRSMATKVVNGDEIGKINSVFGVSEALVNAIYGPIFATFYVATVAVFPGAYCLLSALLISPSIGLFLYMYKLQKDDTAILKGLEAESKENKAFEAETSHL